MVRALGFAVAAATACGASAFVQLAGEQGVDARVRPDVSGVRPAGPALDAVEPADRAVAGSMQSVVMGIALGLVVGLAGVGLPASVRAVTPSDMLDVRNGAKSEKQALAWAKKKAAVWNGRQLTPPYDKKYSTSSTGAGRFRAYGLDEFSPIRGVSDVTDGTYPQAVNNTSGDFLNKSPSYRDPIVTDRLIPALKQKGFIKESPYGNYYSQSSPFKYNPK